MRKASDLLRETREEKGLKLIQAARETKIKERFLEAIERGAYDVLPSESYALGFVKNYAKYLGLPLSNVVPLFRREYDARKNVAIIPEFRKKQHMFNRKAIFSPKGFVLMLVILIVAGYVFFQYSSLIFAPSVQVTNPKDGESTSSNVVIVEGKTDPYATLFINGDEVAVSLDGTFRKSVYEFSGNNKITVVAKNRFGKQSQKVISVKVE